MGFFATIGRGWQLSKLSFSVIKADPELLLYTFLSAIMVFATIGAASYPAYEADQTEESHWAMTDESINPETGESTRDPTNQYMAWIFLTYMVGSIVVVFWNSAIIASAHERLTGGDPSIMTGIKAAFSRIHIIILWGIITGTVGLLLRIARDAISNNQKAHPAVKILAYIVLWLVEVAWWIYTFFIIPMIVLEKKGIGEGLRDGRALFGKTWGENVVSGLGIGFMSIIGIVFSVIIGFLVMSFSQIAGIIIMITMIGLTILLCNTAEVVVVAALYEYAKTGKMPDLNGNGSRFEEAIPWESKSGWDNESAENKAWREGTG
jgi:hypothetical protein|tara:strand:+ start:6294 stop:7256 length:963 start_codon:yes stop_codon:yes gene_type:complete